MAAPWRLGNRNGFAGARRGVVLASARRVSAPVAPRVERESPFHAKGLVYLGAREYYDRHLPGGSSAVAERLPPALARFFGEERFLAGSWYDVLPIAPISAAAAVVGGISHGELVRRNAAWLAHRDVNGVYRALLRVARPDAVAMRLPRASMQYFNFGSADGEQVAPGHFESTRRGIPSLLGAWMSWAVEGFTPVALGYAGAKNITVESSPPVPDGDLLGHRTSRMSFTIRWDAR